MAGRSSADRLSSGEYKYPVWQLAFGIIKKIFKILLVMLALAVLVYGAVVITAARFVYIYDVGYVLTSNQKTDTLAKNDVIVFDAGITEAGDDKYDTATGRLELATLPPQSIAIGEIEAGPTGKMEFYQVNNDGLNHVSIDGVKTGLILDEKPDWNKQYLKDQYIIKCRTGSCEPGKSYLMPVNSVAGIVNNPDSIPAEKNTMNDKESFGDDGFQQDSNDRNASNDNTEGEQR